jgi:hypothetical protein
MQGGGMEVREMAGVVLYLLLLLPLLLLLLLLPEMRWAAAPRD